VTSRHLLNSALFSGFALVASCGSSSPSTPTPTDTFNFEWDWTGIVGTGQSLSVGAVGTPVVGTQQPYGNLKLSLGGAAVPPFDPAIASLSVVPLVEPIRGIAGSYPSAYPANIYGETPHTAMADQITAMAMDRAMHDYVSVHTVVGESGQALKVIKKNPNPADLPVGGTSGRAYDATLFEASAITRLAGAAAKTYGIGAIVLTHGEADATSSTYGADIYQLLGDYNTDLAAITGQTTKIPMLVSQQNSIPSDARSVSTSALQVWKASVAHPGEIVCTGPKYQYSYAADSMHVHLGAMEYEKLGEKYGQVYFERVVLGHDWQPLQPVSGEVAGSVVTVHFHVPVPPLVWDEKLPPHSAIAEWAAGRGFEILAAGVAKTISSVEIVGDDTVQITCANDLSGLQVTVGYAATADGTLPSPDQTARWGQLRDSDPFVGAVTATPQPNYCVAFQMTL